MIMHCVFCNFRSDVSLEARDALLSALADLSATLDGVLGFNSGPNLDFEQKSQDYSDGFVIQFASREDLHAYAIHPDHRTLGQRLCDLCVGGADGVIVFDLSCPA